MRAVRDALAGAIMGIVGLVFGILSGVALAIAAAVPPIFGLFAVLLLPLRVLVERVRRPRAAA